MVSTSNNFRHSSVKKYLKHNFGDLINSVDHEIVDHWTYELINETHGIHHVKLNSIAIYEYLKLQFGQSKWSGEIQNVCINADWNMLMIFNIHTWDSMCLHGGFVTKWLKWNHLKSTLQNIQLEQIYSMLYFKHNVKRNLLTNFILSLIDLLSASDSWYFIHDATATIISYLRFCYLLRQISTV